MTQDDLPFDGPTQSTEDAMRVLEATRHRFIASAREVAHELIRRTGETHARAVREEMARRGELDDTVRDYWLGCVFRDRRFEWTGRWYLPPTPVTGANIHAWRPVKVWTLAA